MDSEKGSSSTRPETLTCWDCDQPIAWSGRCDRCEVRFEDEAHYHAMEQAS